LLKKIGAIAATVLLIGVLALSVMFSLGLLPYKGYAIRTGSMKPAIPPASLVIVGPQQFKPGDVIAFHKGKDVVVHRLVALNSDGTYTTKGDANETVDPSTTEPSDVIGVVTAHYSGLGYWLIYLKQPTAIPGILAFAFFIWIIAPIFFGKQPSDEEPVQEEVSSVQVA
jgi:signal peptidase